MPLIKTLSQTLKQDKEKFRVPKSVQQAIPIRKIWPDGIFQVENKFSRTFRFTDINYSIASKADKTEMFLDYSELLNALDSGCTAKITLNNRKINKEEFEQSLLIPMKGDGLDEYRKEYNDMLLSKISGTNNSIYQERYLTVSVHKKNIDEARTYFARVGTDIITHLAKLSSIGEELDAEQRLQIFRDFFKADVPQSFPFDMKAFAKKMGVTLVMLSQLRKASQSKEGNGNFHEPNQADLMGSGAIGNSADYIILIWRPALNAGLSPIEREEQKYDTVLKITKAREVRNANTIFKLEYDPATSRLHEKL